MERYASALLSCFLLFLLTACSADSLETGGAAHSVVVGFYAGGDVTRTSICQDGLSTAWTEGDRLSLWARNQSGEWTLEKQTFNIYGVNLSRGFFTSTLPSAMPEGDYTYFACYPVPVSVSGTTASFNLPAVQNGKATGAEILVAYPTTHRELTALPVPEDHSGMQMRMRHLLHQFRFYLPQGADVFNGEPIEKIVLSMPSPVVGTVGADWQNPEGETSLTNGGTTVTLLLDAPVSESTPTVTDYAVASIHPTTFSETDSFGVKMYTATKWAAAEPVRLLGRTFAAGHSTPVRLLPGEPHDFCHLNFILNAVNLGENPYKVTFTVPSGCSLGENGGTSFVWDPGHKIAVGESCSLEYETGSLFTALGGKTVTVSFESEHAIVSQTITLPSLSGKTSYTASLTVPYLLYEDFSGISSYSSNDEYSGGFNSGSKSSTTFLGGWSAARFGAQAGTSIRLACRRETSADYPARLDSAPLNGIKNGVTASVSVSFNYGSARREGGLGSNPNCNQYVYIGTTTKSGGISSGGSVYSANVIDWITGGSVDLGNIEGTFGQYISVTGTDGSYTRMPESTSFQLDGLGHSNRITWLSVPTHAAGATNGTYWLYIDNIKVTIVE